VWLQSATTYKFSRCSRIKVGEKGRREVERILQTKGGKNRLNHVPSQKEKRAHTLRRIKQNEVKGNRR